MLTLHVAEYAVSLLVPSKGHLAPTISSARLAT